MERWDLMATKGISGSANMQIDINHFNDFESGNAILRIYSWKPKCISFGYSQKIEDEIDENKAISLGWEFVKRPTGGGIVFHNEEEVTYSITAPIDNPILPKGLIPSFKKISEAVVSGLGTLGIKAQIRNSKLEIQNNNKIRNHKNQLCFSYPAEYEIVVGGKKIVGSAQKRGKVALLQQGSIFMSRTEESVFSFLKKPYNDINAVSVEEVLGRKVGFEEMKNALVCGFQEVLGVKFDVK